MCRVARDFGSVGTSPLAAWASEPCATASSRCSGWGFYATCARSFSISRQGSQWSRPKNIREDPVRTRPPIATAWSSDRLTQVRRRYRSHGHFPAIVIRKNCWTAASVSIVESLRGESTRLKLYGCRCLRPLILSDSVLRSMRRSFGLSHTRSEYEDEGRAVANASRTPHEWEAADRRTLRSENPQKDPHRLASHL